ncbi:hypothetical protein BESB_018420 [Besnoitia besnoiti]|uniref:Bromo domain-containing protein n=1 Tax=Besnoitia besnoiti TaxID=94643 RepID=A0A2A9M5P7_BESBE|nr:hypothetical protein BESB_018420 [Besnoitia besnoiti]PFH32524.1 hypothetical protein BESB_018420 [Besnoitia besnoiti]
MSAPPSIPLFPPPGSTAGFTFASPASFHSMAPPRGGAGGAARASAAAAASRSRTAAARAAVAAARANGGLGSHKRPRPAGGLVPPGLPFGAAKTRRSTLQSVPATRSTRASTAAILQHSTALHGSQPEPAASGACVPYRVGQVLTDALNRLQKKDKKLIFASAVDKALVPDYYVVIKQPMFFEKMKQKIRDREYRTLDAFDADVELIISNCRLYNQPDTPYCRVASLVETCWHKLRERVKVKFAAAAAADAADEAALTAHRPSGLTGPGAASTSASPAPGGAASQRAAGLLGTLGRSQPGAGLAPASDRTAGGLGELAGAAAPGAGARAAGTPGAGGASPGAGDSGDAAAVGASSSGAKGTSGLRVQEGPRAAGPEAWAASPHGAARGLLRQSTGEELLCLLRMAADPAAAARLDELRSQREGGAGMAPDGGGAPEGAGAAALGACGPAGVEEGAAAAASKAKAKETQKGKKPLDAGDASLSRETGLAPAAVSAARKKDPFFWASVMVPNLPGSPSPAWTQTLGPVEYAAPAAGASGSQQKTAQPLYHKSLQTFLGEDTLARLDSFFPDTRRELQRFAQQEALRAPLNDLRIFGVDTADFPAYNSKLSVDNNYLLGVGEGHVQAAATLATSLPSVHADGEAAALPACAPAARLALSSLHGLVQKHAHLRNPQLHPKPEPPARLRVRAAHLGGGRLLSAPLLASGALRPAGAALPSSPAHASQAGAGGDGAERPGGEEARGRRCPPAFRRSGRRRRVRTASGQQPQALRRGTRWLQQPQVRTSSRERRSTRRRRQTAHLLRQSARARRKRGGACRNAKQARLSRRWSLRADAGGVRARENKEDHLLHAAVRQHFNRLIEQVLSSPQQRLLQLQQRKRAFAQTLQRLMPAASPGQANAELVPAHLAPGTSAPLQASSLQIKEAGAAAALPSGRAEGGSPARETEVSLTPQGKLHAVSAQPHSSTQASQLQQGVAHAPDPPQAARVSSQQATTSPLSRQGAGAEATGARETRPADCGSAGSAADRGRAPAAAGSEMSGCSSSPQFAAPLPGAATPQCGPSPTLAGGSSAPASTARPESYQAGQSPVALTSQPYSAAVHAPAGGASPFQPQPGGGQPRSHVPAAAHASSFPSQTAFASPPASQASAAYLPQSSCTLPGAAPEVHSSPSASLSTVVGAKAGFCKRNDLQRRTPPAGGTALQAPSQVQASAPQPLAGVPLQASPSSGGTSAPFFSAPSPHVPPASHASLELTGSTAPPSPLPMRPRRVESHEGPPRARDATPSFGGSSHRPFVAGGNNGGGGGGAMTPLPESWPNGRAEVRGACAGADTTEGSGLRAAYPAQAPAMSAPALGSASFPSSPLLVLGAPTQRAPAREP